MCVLSVSLAYFNDLIKELYVTLVCLHGWNYYNLLLCYQFSVVICLSAVD